MRLSPLACMLSLTRMRSPSYVRPMSLMSRLGSHLSRRAAGSPDAMRYLESMANGSPADAPTQAVYLEALLE